MRRLVVAIGLLLTVSALSAQERPPQPVASWKLLVAADADVPSAEVERVLGVAVRRCLTADGVDGRANGYGRLHLSVDRGGEIVSGRYLGFDAVADPEGRHARADLERRRRDRFDLLGSCLREAVVNKVLSTRQSHVPSVVVVRFVPVPPRPI